jgi:glycine betaine/choline ABC-type transport system substrate-binding protein
MTTAQTDVNGQRKFKLKDDKTLFTQYDPFFIVQDDLQSNIPNAFAELN